MRYMLLLCTLVITTAARSDDKTNILPLIGKPDTFPTLVNPNCSHCRDEATLRAGDLRDDDRVLCWIRGYSNGGAIPHRFFLNKWRVISDSYGVFVFDSDAGYVRGYAPSYEFSFHGWRNGVMVMRRTDGTLFSCLTGEAFEGPGKGSRLETVPTLPSDWGYWLKHYPEAVAYRMFDKYQPVPLAAEANADSVSTRGPLDARLPANEELLGVWTGKTAKAYPLSVLAKQKFIADEIDGEPIVILWEPATKSAAAYRPIANQPRKFKGPNPDNSGVSPNDAGIPLPVGAAELPSRTLTLERSDVTAANGVASEVVIDKESNSRWDVAGRAVEGELKDWTLTWIDSMQVKWFAWSAEYPRTQIYGQSNATADFKPTDQSHLEISEPLGNQDVTVRHFAILKDFDAERRQLTLQVEGDPEPTVWFLEPGAEVWYSGWWGRLDQFTKGDRVWVWFSGKRNQTESISLLADELSEQNFYGPGNIESVSPVNADHSSVVVKLSRGGKPMTRSVGVSNENLLQNNATSSENAASKVDACFFQSTGDEARLLWTPAVFEQHRMRQMAELNQRWTNDGLPGIVAFQHANRRQLEVMLDHESLSWGRTLQPGDRVTLESSSELQATSTPATVQQLRPWRERTQLLLELEQPLPVGSTIDRRIFVKLQAAPANVNFNEPPGLDQPRSAAQRVDWLMSGIYCTCGMHDMCSGHFYTLAACDSFGTNPCGLAKRTRADITERVQQGQTDRRILEELLHDRGPNLLRPHMSP